jgi:hypothetical protein
VRVSRLRSRRRPRVAGSVGETQKAFARLASRRQVDGRRPTPEIVAGPLVGVAPLGISVGSIPELEHVGEPPAGLRRGRDRERVGDHRGRAGHDRTLGGAGGRFTGERGPGVEPAFAEVGHGFLLLVVVGVGYGSSVAPARAPRDRLPAPSARGCEGIYSVRGRPGRWGHSRRGIGRGTDGRATGRRERWGHSGTDSRLSHLEEKRASEHPFR